MVENIYRFGELKDAEGVYWYEVEGKRISCDEDTLNRLHFKWIQNTNGSYRDDDNDNIVFAVEKPISLGGIKIEEYNTQTPLCSINYSKRKKTKIKMEIAKFSIEILYDETEYTEEVILKMVEKHFEDALFFPDMKSLAKSINVTKNNHAQTS